MVLNAVILLFALELSGSFTIASSLFPDSFLDNNEPEFMEEIKNVTVPAGREAVLSCIVSNLGKFKVGWIRAEDQTILTLDTKVVTHNTRVSVTNDGSQTWNLHLRQIKQTDRGCYMCQINTATMKKQLGCIDVHVSPNIIDAETSSDSTVREGDNATLVCRATGHPPPKIIWKREDGEKILIRRGVKEAYRSFENITGDTLHFIRLDRRQMGTFLCIGSNEVPPAVSKRITLDVNFPPVTKSDGQLLGTPVGSDVTLECVVEACPRAFIYWTKNIGEMLIKGKKYQIEEIKRGYKVYTKLTVRNFEPQDKGLYNCVARNSLGTHESGIKLQEIKLNKVTSSATENQVVTRPGYATSPISSGSEDDPTLGRHPNKEPQSVWTTYAVAPRDSGVSHQDPKSDVRRNEIPPSPASALSIKSTFLLILCFNLGLVWTSR